MLALAGALLACGPTASLPPQAIPSPNSVPVTGVGEGSSTSGGAPPARTAAPPTPDWPPQRSERIAGWVGQVSAQRLFEHIQTLAAIPSRHVNSATIGQAAEYIHHQFEVAGGRLIVSRDEFPLVWDSIPTAQVNVVATLPGSDPDAGMVVIGAHYDSRTIDLADATSPAPGANDNATGVAAVLEIARVLAHQTPRATVIFVAFSAEEVGRQGSLHYIETGRALGEDGWRAMLALDIVGNAAGPAGEGAIRVFSADPPDSPSRQLARFAALVGEQYVPGFDAQVQAVLDRPGRYSDHLSFSEDGVAAVRLIEPLEDPSRQHSPLDTPEHVSATYVQHAAQLALAILASIAWGPDAPNAPVIVGDRLEWSPVEGAVAYAVAVRAGDSLEYQDTFYTIQPWINRALLAGWDVASVAAIGPDGSMSAFSPERMLRP